MDKMELQGVRVRKERKVNTKFVHEIPSFKFSIYFYTVFSNVIVPY